MNTTNSQRIVLADWDNTLCAGFTVIPWAEFLEERGLFRGAHTLGTLFDAAKGGAFTYDEFCRRMADAYAAGICGSAQADVVMAAMTFIEKDAARLFGFTRDLFAYFRECALPVVVVTGAPDEPMQHYAASMGFSLAGTLRPQVDQGFYTGGIASNSGLYEQKREVVRGIVRNGEVVMAFGDSPSDVPLWEVASRGFLVVSDAHTTPPSNLDLVRIDATSPPETIEQLVRRIQASWSVPCSEDEP